MRDLPSVIVENSFLIIHLGHLLPKAKREGPHEGPEWHDNMQITLIILSYYEFRLVMITGFVCRCVGKCHLLVLLRPFCCHPAHCQPFASVLPSATSQNTFAPFNQTIKDVTNITSKCHVHMSEVSVRIRNKRIRQLQHRPFGAIPPRTEEANNGDLVNKKRWSLAFSTSLVVFPHREIVSLNCKQNRKRVGRHRKQIR